MTDIHIPLRFVYYQVAAAPLAPDAQQDLVAFKRLGCLDGFVSALNDLPIDL
jgi:hypothetical protein